MDTSSDCNPFAHDTEKSQWKKQVLEKHIQKHTLTFCIMKSVAANHFPM